MSLPRLAALAASLAPAVFGMAPASAQDVEAGRTKAMLCAACHGPEGNSTVPEFPTLAGQTWRYMYLQLKDYKEGRRANPQMTPFVENLSRQDLLDISAFFAAQKPAPLAFKPDPAKVEKGRAKAAEALCTMCHLGGFRGQNEIPRVAGLHHDYVVKQLQDFKAGGGRTTPARCRACRRPSATRTSRTWLNTS